MTEASATQMARQVEHLYTAVAAVCRDVGCLCLAERFSRPQGACGADHQDPCPICGTESCKTLPHMLVKLAPLTHALDQAGYHYLALLTAELAFACEPTLDLQLTGAYLRLLLGDNEDATRIYQQVLRQRGAIPAAEIERLAQLVAAHHAEEDISELYRELSRYACPPNA